MSISVLSPLSVHICVAFFFLILIIFWFVWLMKFTAAAPSVVKTRWSCSSQWSEQEFGFQHLLWQHWFRLGQKCNSAQITAGFGLKCPFSNKAPFIESFKSLCEWLISPLLHHFEKTSTDHSCNYTYIGIKHFIYGFFNFINADSMTYEKTIYKLPKFIGAALKSKSYNIPQGSFSTYNISYIL